MRASWVAVGSWLTAVALARGADHAPPEPATPSTLVLLPSAQRRGETEETSPQRQGRLRTPPTEREASQPFTLNALIELARASHPDLVTARARVEMARGRLIQAGLYPNPTLTWESADVGAGRTPGQQGPVIAQQIIPSVKVRLAEAAAAHGVSVADWQALVSWYTVVTRIRTAYYSWLAAKAEVDVTEELVRLAGSTLEAAQKLQQAGVGTRPDVLRAQVERDQMQLQVDVARQRLDAARALLAIAVGVPTLPCGPTDGSLDALAPEYCWDLVAQLVTDRNAEVLAAQSGILQAERALQRARVEPVPNMQVSARPFYSYADHHAEYTVSAGVTLPVFNRNQGGIHEAEADLVRTRAELRSVQLRLTERLALAFQRYLTAGRQVEALSGHIVPAARESLQLIQAGYQRGDPKYDYVAVFQALRVLAQARLQYVQAFGQRWQAAVEIAGLLQQDVLVSPRPVCAPEVSPPGSTMLHDPISQ